MPYINKEIRPPLKEKADQLVESLKLLGDENLAGNLNFAISRIIWKLLEEKTRYSRINELIGALECIKLEMYRRQAAPYENIKRDSNGDVLD